MPWSMSAVLACAPLNEPIGVHAAPAMTTSGIVVSVRVNGRRATRFRGACRSVGIGGAHDRTADREASDHGSRHQLGFSFHSNPAELAEELDQLAVPADRPTRSQSVLGMKLPS